MKIINVDFKAPRCKFCKRTATSQCDMPKARIKSTLDFKEKVITCDNYICDKCKIEISAGIDICPDCLKKIRAKANNKDL